MKPTLEPLFSARSSREMDEWTQRTFHLDGIVLMEHAGCALARWIRNQLQSPDQVVLVVTGPGNNGGDGWVCARHLRGAGVPAVVLSSCSPTILQGDAARAATSFIAASEALDWQAPSGGPCHLLFDDVDGFERLCRQLRPSLIVDALFGTGLTRPLTGPLAALCDAMNASSVPVVAVDLPSGLPTDGQAPEGSVVQADFTVTFAARKIAHVAEPGAFACGDVEVIDIGILPSPDARSHARVFRAPALEAWRWSVPKAGHKGDFGHVAVVAGAVETVGAAQLAALASLRVGAGLTTMLVQQTHSARHPRPEVMHRHLDAASVDAEMLRHFDTLVVGPGLGRSEDAARWGRSLLRAASGANLPVVVDADALDLLSQLGAPLVGIATPHPGEAARLLSVTTREVQQDRMAAAEALLAHGEQQGHQLTWVLKGACPVAITPDNRQFIVDGGHSTLSTGGSGDVLAGLLGGLLAAGHSPDDASVLGTRWHQAVGAHLQRSAPRGFLASDIADAIPQLWPKGSS